MRSLPLSQMIRVKRIVDREECMDVALSNMVTKFRDRGYPTSLVDMHRSTVENMSKIAFHKSKKNIPTLNASLLYQRIQIGQKEWLKSLISIGSVFNKVTMT